MSTIAIEECPLALEIPPDNLPDEDGVPLESDWHRLAMTLLIELIGLHMKPREDYFVGGNMFLYFDIEHQAVHSLPRFS